MKPIFKSQQLSKQYRTDGIVIVPFASDLQIKELKRVFDKYCPYKENEPDHFFYSLLENNCYNSCQIRDEIESILRDSYENIFINYKSVLQCFLAKPKGNEDFWLHQDWSYTNELQDECATVWCPLTEVNKENGCLFAIRGSHTLFRNFRSGDLETARMKISTQLEPFVKSFEVKLGDAVIFHPALFHGSYANKSNSLRIIAASIIIPSHTPISYFSFDGISKIQQFKIDEEFFFENIAHLSRGSKHPEGEPEILFEYTHRIVSEDELVKQLKIKNHITDHAL
jgi:hypothetical protein